MEMQPDPTPITGEEETLIRKLGLNENIRTGLLTGKARSYTLTLDRETALPAGSAVCCPLRIGSGFVVKDCDFGHNRSRGILIKASNGEVTGNRIVNSRMAAVLISPEFWWMEAGSSSDVIVNDNIIKGSLQTPIQILAHGGDRHPLPSGAHRNIFILNNRFEDCAWPLIHVTPTSGLSIKDNRFPQKPPRPPMIGSLGRQNRFSWKTATSNLETGTEPISRVPGPARCQVQNAKLRDQSATRLHPIDLDSNRFSRPPPANCESH